MSQNPTNPIEQLLGQIAAGIDQMEAEDMDYEDLEMGIDEGLVVTLETVPGDEFEESHSHILPGEDVAMLHLIPRESHQFHELTAEFTEENL